MMDESFLIETVKEAACFVSQDVRADLKLAHSRDNPYRSTPLRMLQCCTRVCNRRGTVRTCNRRGIVLATQVIVIWL